MSEFDFHEDPLPEEEESPVSEDTGTVYGAAGEAEQTPQDLEYLEDAEDEG